MGILRKLFRRREDTASEKDYWPSVVILLKEPRFPTAEEALRVGQASWGAHAQVELTGSTNNGRSYVLRTEKFFFSINYAQGPYGVEGKEHSQAQQRPWEEHAAWLSIDIPNRKTEELREAKALSACYKLLLVFAFKMWSSNCLGVYFPCEGVTIPNLGELAASVVWARGNGVNLKFLDE